LAVIVIDFRKMRINVSRKFQYLIIFLVLLPFFFYGQLNNPQQKVGKIIDNLSDNKKQTSLDSAVDRVVRNFIENPQNCGISIGISKSGTNCFYNYGESKRNSSSIPNQNTIYELGSLTSAFCGNLLSRAVVEKKIDLEEDIRNYLPGKLPKLCYKKSFIKIKHLATHSSGLPNLPADIKTAAVFDSLNPYTSYSKKMLLNYLETLQLTTEPGLTCDYSNMGMAVLGLILEKVYGKSFEELIRLEINEFYGLPSITVKLSQQQRAFLAEGHNNIGDVTPHWNFDGLAASGALHGNAEDLLNFLNLNLNESDAAFELAHTLNYSGREKLGLGWFIKKTNEDNTLLWQNGATFGFACFAGFIKEKKCSVVILANSLTSVDYIAIALLKYLQQ
jgi:CubicO group peptidase (beta-lactamase class C family)